ncbi:MAG TPA: hypothetical protein VMW47_08465 [Verrucomicrobiae bacterium]|nr:hypothetical protein [Verrucomicrobiae bacterium]
MASARRWLVAIAATGGLSAGAALALARAPGAPVSTSTLTLPEIAAQLSVLQREEQTLRTLVAAAPRRSAAGGPVHATTGASGGSGGESGSGG